MKYKNRVGQATATTGTGTVTLGSAITDSTNGNYAALGSGDNGLLFDVLIVDGSAWEVAKDCLYTHSGTTLTRGTLEESSTGSAISLSGSAKVFVTLSAERLNSRLMYSKVDVSYAGTWQYPYNFLLSLPDNLQVKDTAVTFVDGPWIESFTYAESSLGGSLTSLTFNDLVGCRGNISPTTLSLLTTLSYPALVYVGGNFSGTSMSALTTLNCPALTYVGGIFAPGTLAALTTLNCSALAYVGGNCTFGTMASLTTLNCSALAFVGGNFSGLSLGAGATVDFSALSRVMGSFSMASLASVVTLNLASLSYVGASFLCNPGSGNFTNVTFGAVGTTKTINGDISFSNQKLTQASVDQILHTVASLDGTGGTTSWGTGKTLTLNGGTNSTPSATGLTDKAIIVARGATVTNN